MELTNVIVCPYLTEKSYAKRTEKNKKYAFIVNIKANKNDIAVAFEAIFNITPIAVGTMIRKKVATRTGSIHPGFTKAFKIAYITLPEGKDIALSNEDLKAKQKTTSNQKQTSSSTKSENVINIKEVSSKPTTNSSKKSTSANLDISKTKQEVSKNKKQTLNLAKSKSDNTIKNIKEVSSNSTTASVTTNSTNFEKKTISSNTEKKSNKKISTTKQTNKKH